MSHEKREQLTRHHDNATVNAGSRPPPRRQCLLHQRTSARTTRTTQGGKSLPVGREQTARLDAKVCPGCLMVATLSTTTPKPVTAKSDDDDDLLGTAGITPPLLADKEYIGVFLRAEKGRVERRERWFLWFAVSTPGDHLGAELYLSCPFPEGKGRPFGLGSKMVAAYAVATGGLPRRRDRITKDVFRNKLFRFKTRTVTKDGAGALRPLGSHYSVIDHLISVEAS